MLELQTPSAQRRRNPMNFDTLSLSANSNSKLSPWLPRFTRNLHLIKIIQVLASTQDILGCICNLDSIFLLIGWRYIMLCLWQESKVHAEDQDGRICARTLQTFKNVQRFQRAAQRAFPCCSSANGDSRKINELNKRTVTKCERRICENKHITLLIFVAWQGHCVVVSYGNRCTCHCPTGKWVELRCALVLQKNCCALPSCTEPCSIGAPFTRSGFLKHPRLCKSPFQVAWIRDRGDECLQITSWFCLTAATAWIKSLSCF